MDAAWQDLRFALRSLTKARSFAAAAVLVFALGIGINTALFSVVNALFFRPMPVQQPEELAYLYMWQTGSEPFFPAEAYRDFRDHNRVFAAIALTTRMPLTLTHDDQTQSLSGEAATASYFDTLGVRPAIGRLFQPSDDDGSSTEYSIVLSDRVFRRVFGGDPRVVGTTVRICCRRARGYNELEGHFTIVGVAPPEFRGFAATGNPWTPSDFWITQAHAFGVAIGGGQPVARLKRGITFEQAREAVRIQGRSVNEALRLALKPEQWNERLASRRYDAERAVDVRTPFNPRANVVSPRLLAATVVVIAIVLVIAIANIAGLLLSRGVTRTSETAVRLVLGAGWWRIVRQLVSEAALLALAGGVCGLVIAYWLLFVVQAYMPERYALDVTIDHRVLGFTFAICIAAGMLTGLPPAFQAMRIDLLTALPGIAARAGRAVRSRLRRWVVVPQVALSLVLLIVAGLYVRALMHVELGEVGYRTESRVLLRIGWRLSYGDRSMPTEEQRAERARAYYRQLTARLDALSGVSSVAVTNSLPMDIRPYGTVVVSREDFFAGRRAGVDVVYDAIGSGYFGTMDIRIAKGRDFDGRELRPWAPEPVAIVNESLARRLWPGQDPLGRYLAIDPDKQTDGKIQWREVVGVVNDTRTILDNEAATPFVYVPQGQEWRPYVNYVVARVADAAQVQAIQDLKRAVTGADPLAEVYSVQTLDQIVAELLYPRRMAAAVLSAAGLIGLLLAMVGLYGVMSYSVAQRVHEMGVRVTLGARRIDLVNLVIREGVTIALLGSLAGFGLTYAAVRLASGLLGAPGLDVLTLVVVPLMLLAVVVLACYVPARRASRVDPQESLRAL